ncbi:hypothetical protein ScPMuIL_000011 [Solemya velum]
MSASDVAKPVQPHKHRKPSDKKKYFVDFKKVTVKGGNGGNGCLSFLRLPLNPWAGPDGGDGGNGGHVVLTATTNKKSLNHLSTVLTAEHGIKGRNKNCHGKNAEHSYFEVPLGTVIKDSTGQVLTNLEDHRDYYVAARGGAGGKGNYHFLSNENRAPAYAEEGAKGEERKLLVELKTMAHAGLIGFPNAGKSTLLRAISRARPKVASYPFTTLNPHVGMVLYDDYEQIAVADIPGLIRGAHENRGLGISFLRHIERCSCLLYVIDLSVSQPWTQLEDLKFELEQYQTGISKRPHAVIGNKIDLPESLENLTLLEDRIKLPVYAISAKNRTNIEPFLLHLREMYDKHAKHKGLGW